MIVPERKPELAYGFLFVLLKGSIVERGGKLMNDYEIANQAYKDTVKIAEALASSGRVIPNDDFVAFIEAVYNKLVEIQKL